MTQDFGDFDEADAFDDIVDWDKVNPEDLVKLQEKFDEVNVIPDAYERKVAVKALVRELNGEQSGSILVT